MSASGPSPLPRHAKEIFISRVCICGGWATHGFIVELQDGTRRGILLQNNGDTMPIWNSQHIISRGGSWVDLRVPGDYLVRVSGNHLRPESPYLCHTLRLEFASGQVIQFASQHSPWRGEEFQFNLGQDHLLYVNELRFRGGRCTGFSGVSTSLHLPLSKQNAAYLQRIYKKQLLLIMEIAQRQENDRSAAGEKALGSDAWWKVLSFLKGYELLPTDYQYQAPELGDLLHYNTAYFRAR